MSSNSTSTNEEGFPKIAGSSKSTTIIIAATIGATIGFLVVLFFAARLFSNRYSELERRTLAILPTSKTGLGKALIEAMPTITFASWQSNGRKIAFQEDVEANGGHLELDGMNSNSAEESRETVSSRMRHAPESPVLEAHSVSIQKGEVGRATEGVEEEPEVCAVCSLDFEPNDLLRVLPCSGHHFFHRQCIDVWLAQSSVCPLCRQNFSLDAVELPTYPPASIQA